MSELDAIDTYGDGLFGHGAQAALETLGKTYELAFMKALSQLSSPSATDRRPAPVRSAWRVRSPTTRLPWRSWRRSRSL